MVSTKLVVWVSLGASAIIGAAKFVAYLMTGNASMLSQTLYSAADVANQLLLLVGFRLSEREASRLHPFGRGKEQFFFAFVVTMLLFGIAGFAAVREGYAALGRAAPEVDVTVNYVVLGVALVFESIALYKSHQGMRAERDEERFASITSTFRRTKDAPLLVAATENGIAVVGVVVAIVGIYLTDVTGDVVYDAVASAIIGLLLMAFAVVLAWESRSLLIGEGVTRADRRRLLEAVEATEGIDGVVDLRTMHLGPDLVLVACDVRFDPALDAEAVATVVQTAETAIRETVPEADRIYIEASAEKRAGRRT